MARSSEIQNAGPVARLTPATAAAIAIFNSASPRLGAPSNAAILQSPGTGRLRSRLFEVQLSGVIYAAAATTAQISVQLGTDTNPANNTTLAQSTAVAVAAGVAIPFSSRIELIYDSVQGFLAGSQTHLIGGTLVPKAVILSNPTGLSDANEPVFSLVAGLTLSAVNASTYAILDTFAIEA